MQPHPTDSLKNSVYSSLMTLTLNLRLYACRMAVHLSLMRAKNCYGQTHSERILYDAVSNMMCLFPACTLI